MEQFAPQVFDKFADRMVLAQRDVTFDAETRRYHVLGSPTFVLLNSSGRELTRFTYEATAARLEARLGKYLLPLTAS